MPSDAQIAAPKASRREQIGWYFYDWGNSAFSTTVVTVFLGPYLTVVTQAAGDANGFVYPLGIPVLADSFFAYMVSLSVVLQVFFLPILGALADYSNRKKQMLGVTAYIGAIATMGLYFLQGDNYLLGGIFFLIANLSFGASIVFYNAFLPEIATAEERDKVSSEGWALGYLGGGLLLAVNLVFVQFLAEPLGVSTGHAVRISLASAGLWWAVFTIIPLLSLKRRRSYKSLPPGERLTTIGFKQLRHTLSQLPKYPQTLLFLAAYLLYNDGIQTVIALSAQFGAQELGMQTASLIQLILMVQFIAFVGALGFGRMAKWIGAKRAILISLVIWLGVTVYTYAFLQTEAQFFVLGGVIAIVLGGSQALSRSVFSQMIPTGQEAEYFSLYEVSERGTSWIGPLIFGLTLQFTGSYRLAILSIAIFFAAGLILLTRVDIRRAIIEAGHEPPAGPM
jgi:MFS transporter, UMF1 family